jgi:hypothetical protein
MNCRLLTASAIPHCIHTSGDPQTPDLSMAVATLKEDAMVKVVSYRCSTFREISLGSARRQLRYSWSGKCFRASPGGAFVSGQRFRDVFRSLFQFVCVFPLITICTLSRSFMCRELRQKRIHLLPQTDPDLLLLHRTEIASAYHAMFYSTWAGAAGDIVPALRQVL